MIRHNALITRGTIDLTHVSALGTPTRARPAPQSDPPASASPPAETALAPPKRKRTHPAARGLSSAAACTEADLARHGSRLDHDRRSHAS